MSADNSEVLVQMAEVKGQLSMMLQLMQQNHDSTHQRINDFRLSVEGRLAGVETRLKQVETNERSTAIKAAGGGALSGAIVAASIEVMKRLGGG